MQREPRGVRCGRTQPAAGAGSVPPCVSTPCGQIYTESSAVLPSEDGPGLVRCPDCNSPKGFTRHRHAPEDRRVAARWPDATRKGWTPMPRVFHWNAHALGLDLGDIGLIDAMEAYRTTADDEFTESFAKLAKQTGVSSDTIARRVAALVESGLLEKRPRKDPKSGATLPSAYTRKSLTRALAHIEDNLLAGREAEDGLAAFLAELRAPHPQDAAPPTGSLRHPHPQDAAALQESSQEGYEQEPLTRPDPADQVVRLHTTRPPVTLLDVYATDDALVEAVKATFGAEEVAA